MKEMMALRSFDNLMYGSNTQLCSEKSECFDRVRPSIDAVALVLGLRTMDVGRSRPT